MKKYRTLVPIVLIALMLMSCYSIVNNAITNKKEFDACIATAQAAAKKEISVDVDDSYQKALEYKNDVNVYIEWINYYQTINDYGSAVSVSKVANEAFPKNDKIYYLLLNSFIQIKDYESFFESYKKCVSLKANNEDTNKLYNANKYVYKMEFGNFSYASPFSNGISKVAEMTYSENDQPKYGFYSSSGSIPCDYAYVGDFNYDDETIAPVTTLDGECYFVNGKGQKKVVIKPEKVDVKQLGMMISGVCPLYDGQKYYLCDRNSNILAGPYDDITAVSGGVAAAKSGDQWQLIDAKGKEITNEKYEDVITDSKKVCYRNGVFVKKNGKYILLDDKGKQITSATFDDAKLFIDGFAAVKSGEKWGYINQKGEIVVDYQYIDAMSFSGSFAPIYDGTNWSFYVYSKDGKMIKAISGEFSDTSGFDSKGKVAFVRINDVWNVIQLFR